MTVRYISANEITSDIHDILEEDGCVIITDLASKQDIHSLEKELEPIFEITPNSKGIFHGYNTRRFGSLIKKSQVCQKLVMCPEIMNILDDVLGLHCSRYQLSLTQAIRIYPGEDPQILHTDDTMYPFSHPYHQSMVNVMWAYSDFTEENGATRLIPGSHLWDEERKKDPAAYIDASRKVEKAVMPKGSALVYYGSLWHSGGQNTSSKPRTGVVFSYNLGWLRQAENQYLAVPPSVAKKLPSNLRELIGYAIHEPNLGWYEGQSPESYFHANSNQPLATEDHFTIQQKKVLESYVQELKKINYL